MGENLSMKTAIAISLALAAVFFGGAVGECGECLEFAGKLKVFITLESTAQMETQYLGAVCANMTNPAPECASVSLWPDIARVKNPVFFEEESVCKKINECTDWSIYKAKDAALKKAKTPGWGWKTKTEETTCDICSARFPIIAGLISSNAEIIEINNNLVENLCGGDVDFDCQEVVELNSFGLPILGDFFSQPSTFKPICCGVFGLTDCC